MTLNSTHPVFGRSSPIECLFWTVWSQEHHKTTGRSRHLWCSDQRKGTSSSDRVYKNIRSELKTNPAQRFICAPTQTSVHLSFNRCFMWSRTWSFKDDVNQVLCVWVFRSKTQNICEWKNGYKNNTRVYRKKHVDRWNSLVLACLLALKIP